MTGCCVSCACRGAIEIFDHCRGRFVVGGCDPGLLRTLPARPPFQGFVLMWVGFQGRCPWLPWFAPLGLGGAPGGGTRPAGKFQAARFQIPEA